MNVLLIKKMMPFNSHRKVATALTLACGLLLTPSHAAKIDLQQEITIKSQRQSADLKNKIASYLDSVKINQGSISITADIVKVFSSIDKETSEENDTYLAKGQPAIFQQQLEDGSLISLQADEIKYTPHSNIITISGNALVKQAGSQVSGNEIIYNTLSEQLSANSANDQPVTTVLQPAALKQQKESYDKSKVNSNATEEESTRAN